MSKPEVIHTPSLPLVSSYTKFDQKNNIIERSSTPFRVKLEPHDDEFIEMLSLKCGWSDSNAMSETGFDWVDNEGHTRASVTIAHDGLMFCTFSGAHFPDDASRDVQILNAHTLYCEMMGLPLTGEQHPYFPLSRPARPLSCDAQECPECHAPLPAANKAQA